MGIILDLQILQVARDDFFHEGPCTPQDPGLNEKALLEIVGGDPGGIELLDLLEHPFHKGRIHLFLNGNLLQRSHEIAVLVQVADDLLADTPFIGGHLGKQELPHEVVGER